MQPLTCCGVHPGAHVVSFLLRIGARFSARRIALYSVNPNLEEPASWPPVTDVSVGAFLPSGPITLGSQS